MCYSNKLFSELPTFFLVGAEHSTEQKDPQSISVFSNELFK